MINANAMVQVGINQTIKAKIQKYNKKKFEKAVSFALTQTKNHTGFFPVIKEAFGEAGVALIALPNLKNSGINGATKRVNGKIMLMVNDRRHYADTFWFTLFHEIGHILNGDLGVSLHDETEDEAKAAKAVLEADGYKIEIVTHPLPEEQETGIITNFSGYKVTSEAEYNRIIALKDKEVVDGETIYKETKSDGTTVYYKVNSVEESFTILAVNGTMTQHQECSYIVGGRYYYYDEHNNIRSIACQHFSIKFFYSIRWCFIVILIINSYFHFNTCIWIL